ncbi:MAG: pentapeptide repeat-containing protein [Syntrophorhabdales bacterium]
MQGEQARRRPGRMARSGKFLVLCLTLVPLLDVAGAARAFKPEDMNRLKTTKQCPFCDLSAADLASAELSGGRLSGARLSDATLSNADLSGANLRNADLRRGRLLNANLSNADLSGANLTNADLSGASLSHAKLSGAELSGAKLSGTDLSGANLSGAYWVDDKKCGEGSIGECKKDSGKSEQRPRVGRGSRGGPGGF